MNYQMDFKHNWTHIRIILFIHNILLVNACFGWFHYWMPICKLWLNLHTSMIQTFHMHEEWNSNPKIIIAFKCNWMNTLLRKLLVWFNISLGLYLKLISEVNILEYWMPIPTCVCHPILATLIPRSMSVVPMKHCVPIVGFVFLTVFVTCFHLN
jgi:hypothetical protein